MLILGLISAVAICLILGWEDESLEDAIRQAIIIAPAWDDDNFGGPML